MNDARIGISLGPLLKPDEVLRIAKCADLNPNVHSIWVPESWGRESFATIGALTQTTTRVYLGSSIVNVYSRSAATIAMGAATIDALSNGRMLLGLGSSTETIVSDWHGRDFVTPITRMEEYVDSIRLILSGEKANYDGKIVRMRNFRLLNEPYRKQVPIYVAAVNPRMMSVATQVGDGILLYLRPLHEIKETVRQIRTRIAGKPFEIALSIICAVSEKDPEKAKQRASQTLAFYVAVGRYYASFLSRAGFEQEVNEIIGAYKEGGAQSAQKAVSRNMLESLTISGSADECKRILSRFIDAGITLPILQMNPVEDEGSFMEFISFKS